MYVQWCRHQITSLLKSLANFPVIVKVKPNFGKKMLLNLT